MKTIVIGIVFLCTPIFIQAQETEPVEIESIELSENGVYVDVRIGIPTLITANYARKIFSGEILTWYGRVGAGNSITEELEANSGGLAGITMLTGKENGHFELSVGVFVGIGKKMSSASQGGLISPEEKEVFGHPIFSVGYRYQKPGEGLMVSAKLGLVGLGIGLSIGYAF